MRGVHMSHEQKIENAALLTRPAKGSGALISFLVDVLCLSICAKMARCMQECS